ncbi:MAG: sigma-70 family RNA polymerase sigma factor [Henriciella sp.]|uniref:sigma-70 family RNA polymerase sigma factor n=1 Tax=Henriciella sp. TaxID=1968823 RepID=UPI003C76872A
MTTIVSRSGEDVRALHAGCMKQIAARQCRSSFGTLFEYYGPRLKSYLRRMGADEVGSEEIVQDVMLTVWRKAGQFDEAQASVSTWIFRIARNRQIDLHRQASRPDLSPEEPMLQPAGHEAPDQTLSRAQIADRVREQLKTLPEEQLTLLKASFYEGLSHSQIAKAYDLPLGTVKSRIRLAFERLRGKLPRD